MIFKDPVLILVLNSKTNLIMIWIAIFSIKKILKAIYVKYRKIHLILMKNKNVNHIKIVKLLIN